MTTTGFEAATYTYTPVTTAPPGQYIVELTISILKSSVAALFSDFLVCGGG
jgi:hypothetical protein